VVFTANHLTVTDNAKPKYDHKCTEVKTVSPTHLQLTATASKSAFFAFHGLHEISVKLTPRQHYNSA